MWLANEWIDPLAAENLGWHQYMWVATAATTAAVADTPSSFVPSRGEPSNLG